MLRSLVHCLERRNQAFDDQGNQNHYQESGQEATNPRWPANVHTADDLLFGNGLSNLQRDHCRRKEAHHLDDLLGGCRIETVRQSQPSVACGDDDQRYGRRCKKYGQQPMNERERTEDEFHFGSRPGEPALSAKSLVKAS